MTKALRIVKKRNKLHPPWWEASCGESASLLGHTSGCSEPFAPSKYKLWAYCVFKKEKKLNLYLQENVRN